MKKKIMKRLAAAGLSIITLLGMSATVFADENTSTDTPGEKQAGDSAILKSDGGSNFANITVKNLGKSGSKYDEAKAYKVVNITYDPGSNNVTYEWASDAIKTAADAVIDTDNKIDNFTVKDFVDAYEEKTDDKAKADCADHVYSAILKVISQDTGSWIASENNNDGTAIFKSVNMGQYIVKVVGNDVYQAMTATLEPVVGNGKNQDSDKYYLHSVVLNVKHSNPTLTKNIVVNNKDKKITTVTIGDDVTYKVDVTAPEFPEYGVNKTFQVKDKANDGLIGIKNLEVVVNGSKLENTEDTTYYEVIYKDKDGNVTTPENAVKYEINFVMDKVKDVLGTDKKITIKYDSEVTTDFVTKGDSADATLFWPIDTWVNANDLNTLTEGVRVYTFGIDGLKFEKGNESKGLKGAEFKLYESENGGNALKFKVVNDSDGITKYVVSKASDATDTIKASDKGKFYIYGLGADSDANGDVIAKTYYLEETRVPTGYTLLTERQAVTITPVVNSDKTMIDGVNEEYRSTNTQLNNKDYYTVAKVANVKGFTLPKTGDTAMFFMSIAGVVIALLGIAYFVISRRKYSKEN